MAKRILLADDSITIQKVVELTFSDGDYEVTAVNNGTKAIQKLSEMRPDIILSDIIMPEKNGYEVCEFVKSHPEFRSIPVILLTGTFEPFDPDRADKAGCDAVVTKPFESQSLIHKVEELIEHAKSQAPTAQSEAFAPETQTPPADSFATGTFQPAGEVFAGAGAPAPAAPAPPAETPFEQPTPVGETRAFPRMSFDELQKMAAEPAAVPPPPQPAPPPPAAEPTPWDEAPVTGGETRAFPRMSFDEMEKAEPAAPPPPQSTPPTPAPEPTPWDEAPITGGETRAFPRMSFDDLHKMAAEPAPPPPAAPEPPPAAPEPWAQGPAVSGGETRAFPRMTFEDLEKAASQAPPPPPEPAAPEAPPWGQHEEAAAAPAPSEEAAPPQIPVAASQAAAAPGELTDEQIDRIARRVVQLMSDQVVKNIAWEVIPDLAETVVKERIRQLESE